MLKVCLPKTIVILCLVLATANATYAASSAAGRTEINGYLQSRFEVAGSESDTVNGFLLRRARIGLTVRPNNQLIVKIELSGDHGGTCRIRDAFVRYYLGNGWKGTSIALGQMKIPFGLEIQESSRDRLLPERAQWVNYLFPETRQKGLLILTEDGKPVRLILGLLNGNTGPSDNNSTKDFIGRLEFRPVSNIVIGSSVYTGDRRVIGGDIKATFDGFVLTGEYVRGRHLGVSSIGWMLQGALSLDAKNTLVCRVDYLDEGTGSDDRSTSYNLGLVRDINKNLTTKLVWEHNRESGQQKRNDVFRAEVVVKF